MDPKFLSPYDPNETEPRIYAAWEKSGLFNPDQAIQDGFVKKDAPTFSIVLPPPNVTGTLHMGSALMLAIEDTIVRYERMSGKRTLWLPGTDHAAIATQAVVEKKLEKEEGKRKTDLGREAFLEKVTAHAEESKSTILSQMRSMGASLDWTREAYTLDEARNYAVRTAFKKMYDDGLIYRGHRIVNWDPKGQTVISDDELVYEETKGFLYTFRYAKDFPISIATTRPETKFGDTAVAVHPTDERYKQYIGQTIPVTFLGKTLSIKIVGDEAVDPTFGTGAVGVTPAHSQVDWEIARRHEIPLVSVITEYAKMNVPELEWLHGKKTSEARALTAEKLREAGLIEKEEEVSINITKAERTGGIIEPLPKLQWFIGVTKPFTLTESHIPGIASGSTTTLKEVMKKAVEGGGITVLPDRFNKTYFHWIDNLRDWCISRQIWFGHRIPVWYRGDEVYCDVKAPEGTGWEQDSDTLDTWFSSGLWTFSTLGWPEKTKDLETYHPTTLLETAYDILFFWVARMILMSGYFMGTVPFQTVYLHGLVRDREGRKISKSLGNNIDPRDMAKKYGADAVRMSLLVGVGPGNDSKIFEEKIKSYKLFANKLWNMARFVVQTTEDMPTSDITPPESAYIDELHTLVSDITQDFEHYRMYLAGEKLYHYVWHTVADKILEEKKEALYGDNLEEKQKAQKELRYIFITVLKLLHPFMPFITEDIWQRLPAHTDKRPFLLIEQFPRA
jgi:valyl-tRNA synthetase